MMDTNDLVNDRAARRAFGKNGRGPQVNVRFSMFQVNKEITATVKSS